MNQPLRIVYMGTPEFAVAGLRKLLEGGYNVVGVVTMPDKPVGRHQETLTQSAVKQYAVAHGVPVLQPERLRDEAFLTALRSWQADLQVVVAFRMLPEVVWNMPRLGTFNLHASLLPQYRGAAPINWAVINGEKETGVTTFFLQHDIDTGDIIEQRRIPIGADEDAGSVHDRLMELGAQLVTETVDRITEGNITTTAQKHLSTGQILYPAPKIFKETCHINWNNTAQNLHNFIRGLSPYPAAWTLLRQNGQERLLKIHKAHPSSGCSQPRQEPTLIVKKNQLLVELPNDEALVLDEVQLAGKRRMSASDFLRGFRLDGTETLE